MTRPTKREFQPQDLLDMDVDEHVLAQRHGQDVLEWGKLHKAVGPTGTFELDGHPVACGGFHLLWEGTADLWATIERHVGHGVVAAVRLQVEEWIRDYGLDRVQSITPDDWEEGKRFLEWMGMEREGLLRKMGPNGIDQVLYARVRDG